MQEAFGAPARRPRSSRGELTYGSGEDRPSRVAELERERAALEMFARVAAHELVAPLIAAETRVRLIADEFDDRVDGHVHADLDDLLRTLGRLRLLVDTLLQDARSSGQSLARNAVNLERLVRDSVASLDDEVRARDARIVTEALPVVRGDGVLLGVVLNNLILNALRYGPREGGEVRVDAERDGPRWRISVTSQGPTISEEDRARIFAPYQRGTHERRGLGGTGLGLTICRSIVERHGGVIVVAPLGGGGNRFSFTIPDASR